MSVTRERLIEELKRRVGLTDEQAARAVEVFEDLFGGQVARGQQYGGLLGGAVGLFEEKDQPQKPSES